VGLLCFLLAIYIGTHPKSLEEQSSTAEGDNLAKNNQWEAKVAKDVP